MSISTEITRIKTNITNAYTKLSEKGATLPALQNSGSLADAINTIKLGGDIASLIDKSITEIEIPDSVKSIGIYAFYKCINLTNIIMSDEVIEIGYMAFANCTNLTNIIISNSLTSIGELAFSSCSALKEIIIPRSVTIIGARAFTGCSNLIINCEIESQPSGWSSSWNPAGCVVNWNYTKN